MGLRIKKRKIDKRITTVEPSILNIKRPKISMPKFSKNSSNAFFFFDIKYIFSVYLNYKRYQSLEVAELKEKDMPMVYLKIGVNIPKSTVTGRLPFLAGFITGNIFKTRNISVFKKSAPITLI